MSGVMSVTLLWVLAAGMVISAVCLIAHDRRELRIERFRMLKMSGENLFKDIQDILRYTKTRKLDVLEIHSDYILFRYFHPEPWEEQFRLTHYGYRPLSPTRMRTLAFLIRAQYEELGDPIRYRFGKTKSRGRYGNKTISYYFVVKSAHKTSLGRANDYTGATRQNLVIRRND